MAYEFSDSDGKIIKNVGHRLTYQGILMTLAGIGGVIYSAINFSGAPDPIVIYVYLFQSVVEIVIGISLLMSPAYFKRVAETEGNDVSELIGGLSNLNKTFIIVWVTITLNLILDLTLIGLAEA